MSELRTVPVTDPSESQIYMSGPNGEVIPAKMMPNGLVPLQTNEASAVFCGTDGVSVWGKSGALKPRPERVTPDYGDPIPGADTPENLEAAERRRKEIERMQAKASVAWKMLGEKLASNIYNFGFEQAAVTPKPDEPTRKPSWAERGPVPIPVRALTVHPPLPRAALNVPDIDDPQRWAPSHPVSD